eukprot:TRINITY_DN2489_c0_g1_i1.p1 TRINITY_DN2489_c0_g1~~TRINITY_DN2489_c0_g1_i1.p1  ORF type:complete len:1423 (+),score=258.10 TRINITY_DN2489_c0_g1_i1:100-4368(+)
MPPQTAGAQEEWRSLRAQWRAEGGGRSPPPPVIAGDDSARPLLVEDRRPRGLGRRSPSPPAGLPATLPASRVGPAALAPAQPPQVLDLDRQRRKELAQVFVQFAASPDCHMAPAESYRRAKPVRRAPTAEELTRTRLLYHSVINALGFMRFFENAAAMTPADVDTAQRVWGAMSVQKDGCVYWEDFCEVLLALFRPLAAEHAAGVRTKNEGVRRKLVQHLTARHQAVATRGRDRSPPRAALGHAHGAGALDADLAAAAHVVSPTPPAPALPVGLATPPRRDDTGRLPDGETPRGDGSALSPTPSKFTALRAMQADVALVSAQIAAGAKEHGPGAGAAPAEEPTPRAEAAMSSREGRPVDGAEDPVRLSTGTVIAVVDGKRRFVYDADVQRGGRLATLTSPTRRAGGDPRTPTREAVRDDALWRRNTPTSNSPTPHKRVVDTKPVPTFAGGDAIALPPPGPSLVTSDAATNQRSAPTPAPGASLRSDAIPGNPRRASPPPPETSLATASDAIPTHPLRASPCPWETPASRSPGEGKTSPAPPEPDTLRRASPVRPSWGVPRDSEGVLLVPSAAAPPLPYEAVHSTPPRRGPPSPTPPCDAVWGDEGYSVPDAKLVSWPRGGEGYDTHGNGEGCEGYPVVARPHATAAQAPLQRGFSPSPQHGLAGWEGAAASHPSSYTCTSAALPTQHSSRSVVYVDPAAGVVRAGATREHEPVHRSAPLRPAVAGGQWSASPPCAGDDDTSSFATVSPPPHRELQNQQQQQQQVDAAPWRGVRHNVNAPPLLRESNQPRQLRESRQEVHIGAPPQWRSPSSLSSSSADEVPPRGGWAPHPTPANEYGAESAVPPMQMYGDRAAAPNEPRSASLPRRGQAAQDRSEPSVQYHHSMASWDSVPGAAAASQPTSAAPQPRSGLAGARHQHDAPSVAHRMDPSSAAPPGPAAPQLRSGAAPGVAYHNSVVSWDSVPGPAAPQLRHGSSGVRHQRNAPSAAQPQRTEAPQRDPHRDLLVAHGPRRRAAEGATGRAPSRDVREQLREQKQTAPQETRARRETTHEPPPHTGRVPALYGDGEGQELQREPEKEGRAYPGRRPSGGVDEGAPQCLPSLASTSSVNSTAARLQDPMAEFIKPDPLPKQPPSQRPPPPGYLGSGHAHQMPPSQTVDHNVVSPSRDRLGRARETSPVPRRRPPSQTAGGDRGRMLEAQWNDAHKPPPASPVKAAPSSPARSPLMTRASDAAGASPHYIKVSSSPMAPLKPVTASSLQERRDQKRLSAIYRIPSDKLDMSAGYTCREKSTGSPGGSPSPAQHDLRAKWTDIKAHSARPSAADEADTPKAAKGSTSLTIHRTPGELWGFGFRSHTMLSRVQQGAAGSRAGLERFLGYRVTHINGTHVRTLPEIQGMAESAMEITLNMVPPTEADRKLLADPLGSS